MSYSASRNDVKKLTKTIENLAQQVIAKIDNDEDFMSLANELVRNSSTLTFTIGEVHAVEQLGANKKLTAKVVSTPRNYHNLRDARTGRFVSKV